MFYILAPNTEDIDAFQTIFRHEIEKIQKKLQTFTKVLRQLEVSFPYLLLMFCDSLVCVRILNVCFNLSIRCFIMILLSFFQMKRCFLFLGGGGMCGFFYLYILLFIGCVVFLNLLLL